MQTHPFDNVEALLVVNATKNDMLVVQPGRLHRGDEELSSVGVWTGVGHREEAWRCVLDQEVLVLERRSVDRLATRPVKPLKVAALQHELGDDPVEDCVLVGEALLVLS